MLFTQHTTPQVKVNNTRTTPPIPKHFMFTLMGRGELSLMFLTLNLINHKVFMIKYLGYIFRTEKNLTELEDQHFSQQV